MDTYTIEYGDRCFQIPKTIKPVDALDELHRFAGVPSGSQLIEDHPNHYIVGVVTIVPVPATSEAQVINWSDPFGLAEKVRKALAKGGKQYHNIARVVFPETDHQPDHLSRELLLTLHLLEVRGELQANDRYYRLVRSAVAAN